MSNEETSPRTAEEWRVAGTVYRQNGEYDTAIEAHTRAIELDPAFARAYSNRGYVHCDRQNYAASIADYTKAIELCPERGQLPDEGSYYYNRATTFFESGELEKALADIKKALELNPDSKDAKDLLDEYTNEARMYNSRGDANYWKRDYYAAIADYTRAIELCPERGQLPVEGDYYYNRALAHDYLADNFAAAIKDYMKALELNPEHQKAKLELYQCKQENNVDLDDGETEDINKMIAGYNAVIADTNSAPQAIAEAWKQKSRALGFLRQWDSAIFSITQGISMVPSPDDFVSRARLYRLMGDYQAALADYDEAIKLKPDEAFTFFSRACTHREHGDHEKAAADYTEAIRLRGDTGAGGWRWFFDRAGSYEDFGEFDKAAADIDEAVKINPTSYVKTLRAAFLIRRGLYDRAIEDLNQVQAEQSGQGESLYLRGSAWDGKGDLEKALADYNAAILKDSNDYRRYVGRSLVYFQKGDTPLVMKDLSQAAQLNSDYIEFFFSLVEILHKDNPTFAWTKPLKKIYDAIFAFLAWCRCKKDDAAIVFQYAAQVVLESVRNTRTFRLRPAGYQNDPEEGLVFYKRLAGIFAEDRRDIVEFLETLQQTSPDNVVFIRSFTANGNSLLMWNSSYGDSGNGVSIGISKRKLNRGTGVSSGTLETDGEQSGAAGSPRSTAGSPRGTAARQVPLNKTGLYNILYIGEGAEETDAKQELRKIAETLRDFNSGDLANPVIKQFLSNLFTFAAHLVKDTSYAHEDECRLIYFDTVRRKNPYLRVQDGVYVETEPVLFEDDSDVVYFGPKVSDMTILKFRHIFKYEGLPFQGSVEKMLRSSGIKFR
jgi:tetratricopeptide (TPR) repeat protein